MHCHSCACKKNEGKIQQISVHLSIKTILERMENVSLFKGSKIKRVFHENFPKFSIKTYVVGTHLNRLSEAYVVGTHLSIHNICFYGEINKIITYHKRPSSVPLGSV